MYIRNREFDFDKHTYIMGILNVTPDSFSDGGSHKDVDRAISHALLMIEEGADMIDIGGESTRPGFSPVSEEDELARVIPVVEGLRAVSDIVISVDTTKSLVAKRALEAGADIINDVSGFLLDDNMVNVARKSNAPCILMHDGNYFKNDEVSDESVPEYVEKVVAQMQDIVGKAINAGVDGDKIIIDPGVGFGKSHRENLALVKELSRFQGKYPILLGCSRKSIIGKALDVTIDKRLEGTIVTSIYGAMAGAGIVRVHDVAANKRAIAMYEAIRDVK